MLSKIKPTVIKNGNILKNVAILNNSNHRKQYSTLPAQEPSEPKIVTKSIPGKLI